MDRTNFHESILPFDPVSRFLAAVDRIIERELPADLPAPLRAKLLEPRLDSLSRRGNEAIQSGAFSLLDDLLTGFANGLRGALMFERQSGELKPWDRADQILRFRGAWTPAHYNGAEQQHVMKMLANGEVIIRVSLREIETSTRTIGRDDIRRFAESQRPRWAEGEESTCTSEQALREAEQAERRALERRNTYTSGPAKIIGQPILEH